MILRRVLFTSSGRISVRREGSDGADCDHWQAGLERFTYPNLSLHSECGGLRVSAGGIALAIAEEQNVSDDPLAADRKLTEEVNKAAIKADRP